MDEAAPSVPPAGSPVPPSETTTGNETANPNPPSTDTAAATTTTTEKPAQPSASATAKSSRKRTKTGCLTCRKRRIKCGEERPTCGNCIKSKRTCEGYNQRVIFKDGMNGYRPGAAGGASGSSSADSRRLLQPYPIQPAPPAPALGAHQPVPIAIRPAPQPQEEYMNLARDQNKPPHLRAIYAERAAQMQYGEPQQEMYRMPDEGQGQGQGQGQEQYPAYYGGEYVEDGERQLPMHLPPQTFYPTPHSYGGPGAQGFQGGECAFGGNEGQEFVADSRRSPLLMCFR